jgi:hypothetical protein
MTFQDLLSLSGTILLSLGGGAAIVAALGKFLGDISAARILEREKAISAREQELLIRRRNVYSKLALSMRVLLGTHKSGSVPDSGKFLEAYDEAALWASDSVMIEVGLLLDNVKNNVAVPGSVSQASLQTAYMNCMREMRKDSGFPKTQFEYRLVSF